MKWLDYKSGRSVLRAALCTGVGLAMQGCSPSRQPQTQPAELPELPTARDIGAHAADVRKHALEFELTAGDLQNTPLTRQRPQLKQAFTQLSVLLPELAGPARTGVFNHQYSVVTQVRDQLANRPERLSDNALVDNGLLATYNALRDLSYTQFYADEDLTRRMEALAASVGRLTRTTGAEHAIQVSDAITTMSGVLTKMASTLYDRNAELIAPATEPAGVPGPDDAVPGAPAAPPVVPPATAPATSATAPAEPPMAPTTPGDAVPPVVNDAPAEPNP